MQINIEFYASLMNFRGYPMKINSDPGSSIVE